MSADDLSHSLVDVAGLQVGHHTLSQRATGCTVVLCPQGAVCGVEVRGGAPGTRETDLLRSENTVAEVHAVLLTGGSAFGLAAADGVMQWLESNGYGLKVGPVRVPIVPTAVLFDLWAGDATIRPDAAAGLAACKAASAQRPAGGRVGAGAGAAVGKLYGFDRSMPGGVGHASARLGPYTVAALMAVNAVGDVLDANGSVLAGARTPDGQALMHTTRALMAGHGPARLLPGTNTTIGVVATDAALTKAQANQLARLAMNGMARAINPLTTHDGDTIFALATSHAGPIDELSGLGTAAAEVVAQAIREAVRPIAAATAPSGTSPAHG